MLVLSQPKELYEMSRHTTIEHRRSRKKFKGKNAYALSAMDECFNKKEKWYANELFVELQNMIHPNHMPRNVHAVGYLLRRYYTKSNQQDGTLGHRESANYLALWKRREE